MFNAEEMIAKYQAYNEQLEEYDEGGGGDDMECEWAARDIADTFMSLLPDDDLTKLANALHGLKKSREHGWTWGAIAWSDVILSIFTKEKQETETETLPLAYDPLHYTDQMDFQDACLRALLDRDIAYAAKPPKGWRHASEAVETRNITGKNDKGEWYTRPVYYLHLEKLA